jgi:hypothetical protein
MVTNPATILFDINGNPHSVIDGYVVDLNTPSLLIAGINNSNEAVNIGITDDRAIKTKEIELEKTVRYDISTNTIYIGYAEPGALESSSVWKIYRILLDTNGNPTEKKLSNDNMIWANRATVSYY